MFKCWQRFLTFSFLTISLLGCTPSVGTPTAPVEQPAGTTIAAVGNGQSTVGTPSASPAASATSIPTSTATPTLPPDAVVVNTLAQEVYPFKQEGNCSLGEAIQTVLIQQTVDGCTLPASSTTVYLPTGTYTLTEADNAPAVLFGNKPMKDRLGLQPAGFPLITNKLTILGNGATIQRSGSTKFGIFQVFVGGDLTLKDLTITGGDTTDYEFGGGGALDVSAGTVMLDHVTLTGNQGQTSGAISNGGTGSGLTLINSLVTKNNSLDDGGGITNNGLLTIKDSEISYNVSKNDGGGIYNRSNQVTLDHSQLLGNLALEGGGLYNDNGVVKIINQSLVSGNVASEKDSSIPHGGNNGGWNL
jgi:hypothetical protein